MRSVVSKLILPEFMSAISWTGKSAGKGPKIKFQKYTNIIQLISHVCISADRNLNEQMVVQDLKYKVIKYAYSRSQVSSTSSARSISTPSPSESPQPIIQVFSNVRSESVSPDETEREQMRSQHDLFGNSATAPHTQQQYTYRPQPDYRSQPAYIPPPTYHTHNTFHQQNTPQQQHTSHHPLYAQSNYPIADHNSYNNNNNWYTPTFTSL